MYKNYELDNYLNKLLGDRSALLLKAENEPRTIRVNTLKSTIKDFEKILKILNYCYSNISWQPSGFVLSEDHAPLSHTLAYFKGLFMYQGLSSQLPVILLDIKPDQYVLDLTSAPGSKSTQIAAELKNTGFLCLNDFSKNRLQALSANMQRTGALNYCILQNRGENLGPMFPGFFDKVLCDVPCSALGTLGTNQEIYKWWSLKKLNKLAQIQYHLLVSAFKTLKVGGELVYSTCTITPEENELVITRLLENYPAEIVTPPGRLSEQFSPGMTEYKNQRLHPHLVSAIRIYPDQHKMEGFFIVKLRKTGPVSHESSTDIQQWKETLPPEESDIAQILMEISEKWGIPPEEWAHYRYYRTKTRIWTVSQELRRLPQDGFVSAGILLAEKRISGWKLAHGSIQYFSRFIKNKKINLDDKLLKDLYQNGNIKYSGIPDGYYALAYQDEPIASIYCESGKLRIRLPHSFNLVL